MGDLNYSELGVYIFILGLIVQSLYRIFDPVIDSVRRGFMKLLGWFYIVKPPIENKPVSYGKPGFETVFDRNHSEKEYPVGYTGEVPILPEEKEPKKNSWKDLIFPPLIGLGVAWFFLPNTVFDYLHFQPRYPIIAYIITSLLISRIANAEYDTFKTIGQFFLGMTNRFFPHS